MAELLTLTTPHQAKQGTPRYRIKRITLEDGVGWDDTAGDFIDQPSQSSVTFTLFGERGLTWDEAVYGEEADALLKFINTADMRPPKSSLIKRAYEWLAANRPALGGSITGTP